MKCHRAYLLELSGTSSPDRQRVLATLQTDYDRFREYARECPAAEDPSDADDRVHPEQSPGKLVLLAVQ